MALETEIHLNQFVLDYLKNLVRDIDNRNLYMGQRENCNSPGWCLGHLVVEDDYALRNLGIERLSPIDWDNYFLMRATGMNSANNLPSKESLTIELDRVYTRLREVAVDFTTEFLSAECHSEFLKGILPSEGLWYSHILTTHNAIHAGNIAIWRRVNTYIPVKYKF